MSARTKDDEPELYQDVQNVAFDEMNLVELPFALLTDARKKKGNQLNSIDLSPDGNEVLESSGRSNLPTALGERVVLGLMWLTMQENSFSSPVIRFSLRRLIHEFMYPNRPKTSRVSGEFFKRVEQEIHRVAATRIYTKRWYDKELGRETEMDAAIIDYFQVREEGGRNAPRILEIRWGDQLFRSVRSRYTKAIDIRTVMQIDRPLDLRFYRWLDRQLAVKPRQVVKSCQDFARFKLLMRGQKIDKGGRTASGYIVRKLAESLGRLNDLGFGVKMTIHRSVDDFRMEFIRKKECKNEVIQEDVAAELIHEFLSKSLGIVRERAQRIAAADRKLAQQWIETYGKEKSMWMIGRCVELHRHAPQKYSSQPLRQFRGLSFYEPEASSDFDKQTKEQSKQSSFDFEKEWLSYREQQIGLAEKQLDEEELEELKIEAQKEVERLRTDIPATFRAAAAQNALDELMLKRVKTKSKKEFFAKARKQAECYSAALLG